MMATGKIQGSGYVYKGNLVFTQDAAGSLSLDCALTAGGRIVARKDTLTGTVTGYSGTLFISGLS